MRHASLRSRVSEFLALCLLATTMAEHDPNLTNHHRPSMTPGATSPEQVRAFSV